jgi:hypothetical protein
MSKKPHPIDDLFRDGLADHEVVPSDESRAAFIREAAGEANKRASLKWWIIGSGLVLVAAGVFVLEEVRKENREEVRKENREENRVEVREENRVEVRKENRVEVREESRVEVRAAAPAVAMASTKTQIAVTTAASAKISASATAKASIKTLALASSAASGTAQTTASAPASSKTRTSASATPSVLTQATASAPVKSEVPDGQTVSETPEMNNPPSAGIKSETIPPSAIIQKDTNPPAGTKHKDAAAGDSIIRNKPVLTTGQSHGPKFRSGETGNLPFEKKSNPPKKWNISAGVYYAPEWMFNTLNGDKYVNNFGAEGTFHFGRYSVRTGLGLSVTTGSNEMLVQTNPYLGSYHALDSVVFKWDQKHYNLIPTYYTTGTKVFDTALRYNYSYDKKRYTYLQVPLILGYDFLQKGWFTLGARAGAVMSVLLKTEDLSGTYDPGMDRIISINNVSPDRIQLNWQALVGINASFRLSRWFSLEAEPDLRYYFDSVYESSEITKKPWSVGFRAAFLITF